jgi:hypothetical protein
MRPGTASTSSTRRSRWGPPRTAPTRSSATRTPDGGGTGPRRRSR